MRLFVKDKSKNPTVCGWDPDVMIVGGGGCHALILSSLAAHKIRDYAILSHNGSKVCAPFRAELSITARTMLYWHCFTQLSHVSISVIKR